MKKILDPIAEVLRYLAFMFFFSIFVLINAEIICRTFLNFSILWANDLVIFMICWMIMSAMAVMVHRKEHLTIEFVKDRMPKKVRFAVELTINVILLCFLIMLTYKGYLQAMSRMRVFFTTLRWPMGYAFMALPVFGFFSSIFTMGRIYRQIKR